MTQALTIQRIIKKNKLNTEKQFTANIQAELQTDIHGDYFEQEADAMAERVMRFADTASGINVLSTKVTNKSTQLKGNECEKENKLLKRKAADSVAVKASPAFATALNESKKGGTAIAADTRRFMEHAFSKEFSDVRVHHNNLASAMNKDIHAKAFTHGRDIYFDDGQYAPGTAEGTKLLAHELTHVVQQENMPESKLQRQSKPDSYFFHTPVSQTVQGASTQGIPSAAQRMQQVYVEPITQQINTTPPIFVRFAFPLAEVDTGRPSTKIENGKTAILTAIAKIIADNGTYAAQATPADLKRVQTERAELSEAFLNYPATAPLNIFIDTASIITTLKTNTISAYTDNVYVNLADVGNRSKLKAAILVPDLLLNGGIVGGGQKVRAATPAELKAILLHEGIHALLIKDGIDANNIWDSLVQKGIQLNGPQNGNDLFTELARKYLIAQEEVFAYAQEALLYPPLSPNVAHYSSYIKLAESFFKNRSLAFSTVSKKINVTQKVNKKPVAWSIYYSYPTGTVAGFTAGQIKSMQLIISSY